jgi:hypothetical protein
MAIDQLSVFVENKPGKLIEVLEALGSAQIDLRALSIADTSDYGILRVIVDKPVDALKTLTDLGFAVRINQVLPVSIDDRPGALADALRVLSDDGVNVEYLYAFVAHASGRAFVIFRVEDNDAAESALRRHGIPIALKSELYN